MDIEEKRILAAGELYSRLRTKMREVETPKLILGYTVSRRIIIPPNYYGPDTRHN